MEAGQDGASALLAKARWTAVDGLKILYIEDGRRSGPDILLLAPWPASLAAFELVWPVIAETRRVVAVELPMLGASEGRSCLSSPRAMAAFVMKAIEAFRLRHPHLAAANLLVTSALYTALDYPGAVESLILGDGVVTADCRSTRETKAELLEKAQAEAWSELTPRLHQIATPVLIITTLQEGAEAATTGLLRTRLQKSRVATVSSEPSEGRHAPLVCGQLVDAWVGGEYRSVIASTP